jgi:Eukaryotic DNA topoisomerase I, catalytic core
LRRDLARARLDRDKVLSALVELMQRTCVRVGNDCYALANGSFGLTTLRDRHATVRGAEVRFKFKGKGGKLHEVCLEDARLARIVRRCREVPGQRLFQFVDGDGTPHAVTSGDVNEYLRRAPESPSVPRTSGPGRVHCWPCTAWVRASRRRACGLHGGRSSRPSSASRRSWATPWPCVASPTCTRPSLSNIRAVSCRCRSRGRAVQRGSGPCVACASRRRWCCTGCVRSRRRSTSVARPGLLAESPAGPLSDTAARRAP